MPRRIGCRIAGLWMAAAVTVGLPAAPAPASTPAYRPDRILVQPKTPAALAPLNRLHAAQKVTVHRTFPSLANLQILRVPGSTDVTSMIDRYQRSGLVTFAEPDYLVHATLTEPNDPKYLDGTLWGLNNTGQSGGTADADIDAPEAWDVRTSASNIVVAVLDTGILATHEDLAANMWVHPVDGCHGWNALTGTNNPADDNGHGTLMAGVLGAVGNNGKGVTGVAWNVRIMALKCLDSSGNGSVSDLITCIDYARTNGAQIINSSLDSDADSAALSNAIVTVRDSGILFVASAGNNGADLDVTPRFPSCYDIDNIVSVGASTRTDALWSLSNYGATQVDLVAPGHQVYSTFFNPGLPYLSLSGTSLAAPCVAGSLALMLAKYPGETHQQIIARLLAGTDPLPALEGKCATGGRLNLRNALSPPVRLTALPSVPGEPFRMRVSGGPDRIFVILRTTDFSSWTPVTIETTDAEGGFIFVDEDSGNAPQQFYKAFAQP